MEKTQATTKKRSQKIWWIEWPDGTPTVGETNTQISRNEKLKHKDVWNGTKIVTMIDKTRTKQLNMRNRLYYEH